MQKEIINEGKSRKIIVYRSCFFIGCMYIFFLEHCPPRVLNYHGNLKDIFVLSPMDTLEPASRKTILLSSGWHTKGQLSATYRQFQVLQQALSQGQGEAAQQPQAASSRPPSLRQGEAVQQPQAAPSRPLSQGQGAATSSYQKASQSGAR